MEPTSIPSHIPADRVRNLSWYGWQDPEGDPPMSLSRSLSGERLFYVPAGARNPFGVWVLTRHDDMQAVLTDGEHFTNSHIAGWNNLAGVDELMIPIELDPPDHTLYRKFMMPFFSRPSIETMRPEMQRGAKRAVDAVVGLGKLDVVQHCYKMTSGAWCALMGVNYEEVDRYIAHLWGMLHQYNVEIRFSTAKEMMRAAEEIYTSHKGRAGAGLFNAFVNSTINGAAPTASQCIGFILFQLLAGLDTMGTTAAWALRHLAGSPALQRELATDSRKILPFVEEIFRRYAVLATNRFVKKDIDIDGVTLKAGDNVLLAGALACMDAAHFSCPADIQLGRKERHLAFGAGPHFCVGAPIARVQLPIALEEWLKQIPSFRLQKGSPPTAHTGDLMGLDSLPLEWP